jgi:hypothetical protein
MKSLSYLRIKLKDLISGLGATIIIILFICLLFGCAGLQKTSQEPLHAESGGGITIWKIPVIGLGGWGTDNNRIAEIIVHKYDYQARPAPSLPGTPPTPPTVPPAADYQTIYKSSWDDPTLVIFKNDSYRKVRIEINNQKPIVLKPYGATSNLHLGLGELRVKIVIEKPTAAHGVWEITRFFTIRIQPEGRSQIIYIYDR